LNGLLASGNRTERRPAREVIGHARRHDLTRRLRDAFANDEPTADLRQHFEAAPAYRPPVAKRYLVNDATVEKLGELLNHNPNGLLLFRDEVSGFLHTMDQARP
jgi:putative DNA primase/helicase